MGEESDITLRVKDDTGEMSFEIRAHTSLKQLMDTYCAKTGRSRRGLGFLVNGAPCSSTETPASLGLVDGDVIDVVPA
ncbi:ubiquitin-like protein [Actinacidiphila sp. bgisy160]|uniref:ubiquitin-like protein n=1 Tax=Actinacidiphila sp. bgisy160 TaxID=3413796 RepID=UPI003D746AA1